MRTTYILIYFLSGNNLPIISIMLLTTAYQQAFWECKDNGNNRIKNNTMSYCRNKACFISVEQKSNQFHSFNLLFVKKKVHFAKPCYNKLFFFLRIWIHLRNSYICTVFFIVLDLRLTKDWLSGKIAFFILSLLAPQKKVVIHTYRLVRTYV